MISNHSLLAHSPKLFQGFPCSLLPAKIGGFEGIPYIIGACKSDHRWSLSRLSPRVQNLERPLQFEVNRNIRRRKELEGAFWKSSSAIPYVE